MSGFFKNFPIIKYGNNQVVNIMERIAPLNSDFSNPFLFYPQDISNGQRADQLANQVYGDPFQSWILFITNKIIDPYYQWFLSQDDFESYLETKYNVPSSYILQSKTVFYRNNWPSDENSILPQTFNALDPSLWKYYTPIYNDTSYNPMFYKRTQNDTIINTNLIYQYNTANSSLISNEIVNVVFNSSNIGHGQVLTVNSTAVNIQHCSGVLAANNIVPITANSYIYGQESGSNTIFTTSTLIANNIPTLEVVYFEPVSIYDYERELNEQNKSILVLNPVYNKPISNQLSTLLNQ